MMDNTTSTGTGTGTDSKTTTTTTTSRPPCSMYCSFQTLKDPTQFTSWDILDKGKVKETRWIVDTLDPTIIYRVMLHSSNSKSLAYWNRVMLAFEGFNLHKKAFNRSSTPFLIFCDGPGKRLQFIQNRLEKPLVETLQANTEGTEKEEDTGAKKTDSVEDTRTECIPEIGEIIPALMTTWNSRAFLETYPSSLDFLTSPFHTGLDLLKVGELYLGSRIWNVHENLSLWEGWKCLELHRGFLKGSYHSQVKPDQLKMAYDMEGLVLDPLTLVIPLLVQHCHLTRGKGGLDHHQRQAMAVYVKKRFDFIQGETGKLGLLAQYGDIYPCENPQAGVLSKSQQANMQHRRTKERLILTSFLQKHPGSEWVKTCHFLMVKSAKWLWMDALGSGDSTACLPPTESWQDSGYELDSFVNAVKSVMP